MALTKVKLIADGVITSANLDASHGITTSDIGEGSNLYYTDARVSSYLSTNGFATQTDIVAAITDSAPVTLDTLNELAAALGDDANFSTTVTNNIATKMPLAGGTFTGNVEIASTSAYQAKIKSTGAQYLLIGSTDAGSAGIILDGDSNGDGSGGDYSYLLHEASGKLKLQQDSPSGTNELHFGTAGIESRMVIDSSGNVGIGTSSPSSRLQVKDSQDSSFDSGIGIIRSASSQTGYINMVGGAFNFNAPSGVPIRFRDGGTANATIDGSGNVIVGGTAVDTAGSTSLKNNGIIRGVLSSGTAESTLINAISGISNGFQLSNDASNNQEYIFHNGGSVSLKINSSGNVGIGTTSPVVKLNVVGSAYFSGNDAWNGGGTEGNKTDIALVIDEGDTIYTRDSNQYLRTLIKKDTGDNIQIGEAGTSLIDNINFFSGSSCSYTWYNNSSAAMKLTSTGLGIGTTSPEQKLQVNGAVYGTFGLYSDHAYSGNRNWRFITNNFGAGNWGGIALQTSTGAGLNATTTRFGIDYLGRVGIGTTSPSEIFHVNKNATSRIVGAYLTNSQANTGAEAVSIAFGLNRSGGDFVRKVEAIEFGATQQWTGTPSTVNSYLAFNVVKSETVYERMRVTTNGVDVTSSGAHGVHLKPDTADTNNSGRLFLTRIGGSGWAIMNNSTNFSIRSGAIPNTTSGTEKIRLTGYSATSWTSGSDETIKENIISIGNVLDKINDYRCVEYNLIDDETKDKKIGFIAQDWQEDFPQIIEQMENEKIGMKYTETIPILLKAIQELKADNDNLRERIQTLENQ